MSIVNGPAPVRVRRSRGGRGPGSTRRAPRGVGPERFIRSVGNAEDGGAEFTQAATEQVVSRREVRREEDDVHRHPECTVSWAVRDRDRRSATGSRDARPKGPSRSVSSMRLRRFSPRGRPAGRSGTTVLAAPATGLTSYPPASRGGVRLRPQGGARRHHSGDERGDRADGIGAGDGVSKPRHSAGEPTATVAARGRCRLSVGSIRARGVGPADPPSSRAGICVRRA